MYLFTFILIVNKNSYKTITKVLSDWGYVQAKAPYGEQTVIPYSMLTCTAPPPSGRHDLLSKSGASVAKTFGKRDTPDVLE